MQRYFAKDKNLNLELSDIHHIKNVMRMNVGDKIEVVFNNKLYCCQIGNIESNNIYYDKIDEIENDFDSSVSITIGISLVNEQKWDYILQKCTELGVNKIIPLELSRTLIHVDKDKYFKKHERWQKICKEASEQSHRRDIPIILDPMEIKSIILDEYDLKIVCSTGLDTLSLKQVLQNNRSCGKILVVIGPEGGISKEEEDILTQRGFIKTSLGKLILRVETAPVFVLSSIFYELMR